MLLVVFVVCVIVFVGVVFVVVGVVGIGCCVFVVNAIVVAFLFCWSLFLLLLLLLA